MRYVEDSNIFLLFVKKKVKMKFSFLEQLQGYQSKPSQNYLTKNCNQSLFFTPAETKILVLLSALVKRFGVSRMRDFFRQQLIYMIGVGFLVNQNTSKIRCFVLKKNTETKMVLGGTLWKMRRIQIQIYPQTSIEPKYVAFYSNTKVRVHGLVLLVQLS